MYAVIETGGKQYRVSPGDILDIEKIDKNKGEKVEFNNVLMIHGKEDFTIGTPLLDDTTVTGEVISQDRKKKIIVFKKKKRKNYKKTQGHRQYFTRVKIIDISSSSMDA
ncbi:MAG: 50S ribosomal protein L21 [Nitrospirota bacterium]